jgi:cyclohexadieny/prephenate dehydrogenase
MVGVGGNRLSLPGPLEKPHDSPYNAVAMSQPTESNSRDFETIAIVGVGLIGGSVALAVRARGGARIVLGVGRNARRLDEARRLGVIDEGIVDLPAAAARANLIAFCTPVDRIVAGVRQAAAAARPGTLITDVGSVKACLCRELATGLPRHVEFVGSHPLAGSEKQGFEHADPQLFEKRICVLTPLATNSRSAVGRIGAFWTRLGATLVEMSPEAHDRALAETSHLPHLIAAALAATLTPENRELTASGFRDTTRIAAGDADLWAAIFLENRDQLLASMSRYETLLARFRGALEQNDAAAMKELLKAAKMSRDSL